MILRLYSLSLRAGMAEEKLRALVGRAVTRTYGPRPRGVGRESWRDLRSWARTDSTALVLPGAAVLGIVVAVLGGEAGISTVAGGAFLLLTLVGVHLVCVETAQPSLGHIGFVAIGAYVTVYARLRLRVDGFTAATVGAAVAGVTGWLIGRGTSALHPRFLALATWVFGWLLYLILQAFPGFSGGPAGVPVAPLRLRAAVLGVDVVVSRVGYLAIGLSLAVLAVVALGSARGSWLGHAWRGIRTGGGYVSTLGYDIPRMRTWVFAFSAVLAGLAGGLRAEMDGIVDGSQFSPVASLRLFVAALIGSRFGTFGPVVGVGIVAILPAALGLAPYANSNPGYTELLTALFAVVALLLSTGAPARRSRRQPSESSTTIGEATMALVPISGLKAVGLTRSFAGIRAISGVDLVLEAGEIRGLIGPNGSGKSTTLRALAGAIAVEGKVHFGAEVLDRLGESARSRAGVARTFQRTVTLTGMFAIEQVELALWRRAPHAGWLNAVARTPGYRRGARLVRRDAQAVLQRAGLADRAEDPAESLPGSDQRTLQVATAGATGASVLMFDEPSAGMRPAEMDHLARMLRGYAAEGRTVLLVEHNLRFLAGLADQVIVLVDGSVLVTTTPRGLGRHPRVREAYLGRTSTRPLVPGPGPPRIRSQQEGRKR
ncbi:MAG: branched-chain amino acid ABC transporter ATP-binding protein/permease [Candidatus Dormibacteria bacterium]